jgi:NAD(P)-dependent dehydrogenase (short-subunit alcohol dehydrogenase family)
MTSANSAYSDGIVAVTGASRGLGAEIAMALAERGFTVGCLSRKGIGLEQGEPSEGLKKRMINLACDVTDEASIAAALAELDGREGGLRYLINNAGIHLLGASRDFSNDDFRQVLETNVIGAFAAARAAYPYLRAQSHGSAIINIGSFFDRLATPHNTAYSASKAALGAMNRCLAAEWAKDGISVVNVAPGYIDTDIARDYLAQDEVKAYFARRVPIGRPSQPEEVADFTARLLQGDLTLLTGETIYVDGGHSIDHGRV